ncbi:hypothetical protein MMC30_001766 [Trapelia coarctata]|nr:hypothetical protein [Trapelia coarctata]
MDPNQDTQLIEESLASTPYSCTHFERLSGGYTNSVYRGTLAQPLDDGTASVVVKMAKSISTQEFSIDTRRSFYESTLLSSALPSVSHTLDNGNTITITITIRTPHLFLHITPTPSTSLLIMEHLPTSLDLRALLSSSPLPAPLAQHIGTALGQWTARFHAWGRLPAQEPLRQILRGNMRLKKLKWDVNFGRLGATVERFPRILKEGEGGEEVWVREVGARMSAVAEGGGDVVHGDFWAGNIILPATLLTETTSPPSSHSILILDWELIHLSSIVFDLGQMLAELYLLLCFRARQEVTVLIDAFLEAYGRVQRREAEDVMVVCGVHLMVWPWRVPGWDEGWEEREGGRGKEVGEGGEERGEVESGETKMEGCIRFGRTLVQNAMSGDESWFREGVFRKLFAAPVGGSA